VKASTRGRREVRAGSRLRSATVSEAASGARFLSRAKVVEYTMRKPSVRTSGRVASGLGTPTLLYMGPAPLRVPVSAPYPAPFRISRPLHLDLCHMDFYTYRSRPAVQQAATADGVRYKICNTRSIFAASRGNICNKYPKQLKHLQHMSKT
jgi:hypothetical protein